MHLTVEMNPCFTDVGWGTYASALLRLRTAPAIVDEVHIRGMGFSKNPLEARLAAEGEAIERATWQWGHTWNQIAIDFKGDVCRPEEVSALSRHRSIDETGWVVPGWRRGTGIGIPAEYVFPNIGFDFQEEIPFVSTGWAFSSKLESALRRSLMEVIERDLLMRFWYHLPFSIRKADHWLHDFGWTDDLGEGSNHYALLGQVTLGLDCLEGYFCIIAVTGSQPPYLTTGQALELSQDVALEKAWRELVMLRTHQYDCILRGEREGVSRTFQENYLRATYAPDARDRFLNLVESFSEEGIQHKKANYEEYDKMWISLQPPTGIAQDCFVTKVWVDGCQPMVPGGVDIEPVGTWRTMGINGSDLIANRWHPFP